MFGIKRSNLYKFVFLWLLLSLLFFGMGYFIYCFVQMSHGDLNHNGVVDGADIAIVSAHSDDTANRQTTRTVLVSPPTANTAGPTHTTYQPVIFEQ